MKSKLKFLLIQARKLNDPMIQNELDCFKRVLDVDQKNITIKDITREIIKESFIKNGGENFDVVPCLNDNDDHITLLKYLAEKYFL